MSMRRLVLLSLTASWLLLQPHAARASHSFPENVQSEWQLPETPACTLCHQTLLGGFGTATKPFGRALLKNGATAVDANALRNALRKLQADESDVDHDGISDYDELQTGTDPDVVDVMDADGG